MTTNVHRGLRAKLRRAMPAEAVKPDPSSGRSAVNSMFVIERLNDVFGEDGWTAQYSIIESGGQMVVVKCDFEAIYAARKPHLKICRQTFGGNANADRGDAYKGACTDALTKAASQIGIASHVYKGIGDPVYVAPATSRLSKAITGKQLNELNKLRAKSGKSFEDMTAFLRTFQIDTAPGFKIPESLYQTLVAWATPEIPERLLEAF